MKNRGILESNIFRKIQFEFRKIQQDFDLEINLVFCYSKPIFQK